MYVCACVFTLCFSNSLYAYYYTQPCCRRWSSDALPDSNMVLSVLEKTCLIIFSSRFLLCLLRSRVVFVFVIQLLLLGGLFVIIDLCKKNCYM